MPAIIPSSKLRNNYNEVSEQCHATGQPVFVTRNGAGDLVLMSNEAYDRLTARRELVEALDEGHRQLEAGLGRNADDVIARLREKHSL